MGKKKNNHNHNHNHENDHSNEGAEKKMVVQKKEGSEGGENKEGKNNTMTVILKIEMHCEGCASKVVKLARSLEGVESVKADSESNKLTLTGKTMDPSQIREILHQKTKKKVDLISPQPTKEDANNNNNNKDDNKKSSANKPDAAENQKPKEAAAATTAVMKVEFHCLGCIQKIHKIVSKTEGVQEMSLDRQKETVTVKGAMDVKSLSEALKDRLKRPVEIIPPKKEKDGNGGAKDGGGGGKKKKGGDDSEGGQDNAGGGGGGGGDAAKMEGNRMEYIIQPGYGFGPGPGFGYMGQPVPVYGNGYMGQPVPGPVYGNGYMGMAPPRPLYGYGYGHGEIPDYPVHMKFNDENPNACSVM